MNSLKKWFNSHELEGLDGLPASASNITRKATRENWEKRQVKGKKGVSFEYYYSSLPVQAQKALGFSSVKETETKDERDKMISYASEKIDLLKIDVDALLTDYRSVRISAGYGAFNEEDSANMAKVPVEAAWLAKRGFKARDCGMFRISGDSMEPTLCNGEDIVVHMKHKELSDGDIFVLNHQGTLWVKKVQVTFDGVKLLSENKFYDPIVLDQVEADKLVVIGRVVRCYRDF